MQRIFTAAITALVLAASAGCAGTFGHTSYTVKANSADGYDFEASDGKEYTAGRSIMFNALTGVLVISEGPSDAFKGQALGVKALNILPTMGLGDILSVRDK